MGDVTKTLGKYLFTLYWWDLDENIVFSLQKFQRKTPLDLVIFHGFTQNYKTPDLALSNTTTCLSFA